MREFELPEMQFHFGGPEGAAAGLIVIRKLQDGVRSGLISPAKRDTILYIVDAHSVAENAELQDAATNEEKVVTNRALIPFEAECRGLGIDASLVSLEHLEI